MENRIDRKRDESLYQPKTQSERIRTLYSLKQATGKPITALLDQAIHELAERHGTIFSVQDEPVRQEVQVETWTEYQEYRQLSDEMKYLKCLEELEKIKREQQT